MANQSAGLESFHITTILDKSPNMSSDPRYAKIISNPAPSDSFPIRVDINELFKDDEEYDRTFESFISSMPGPEEDATTVEKWLRTWFGAAGAFQYYSKGVLQFCKRVKLSGKDLGEGTPIHMVHMAVRFHLVLTTASFYGGKIMPDIVVASVYDYVQRARLVNQLRRGLPVDIEYFNCLKANEKDLLARESIKKVVEDKARAEIQEYLEARGFELEKTEDPLSDHLVEEAWRFKGAFKERLRALKKERVRRRVFAEFLEF
ncbi:hypothetical protein HYFRA_00011994 [Hymenoscyphus fraxineus]|uniref:Uncharacterized protein n=1 Tax=Hymenoscyphus fraxineus TaxID=746836 RepID=A0A9N9L2A1_9HELO|nr:hypothetical protein HYFRA_00011994 [Hymenoscyphus fraxineus]